VWTRCGRWSRGCVLGCCPSGCPVLRCGVFVIVGIGIPDGCFIFQGVGVWGCWKWQTSVISDTSEIPRQLKFETKVYRYWSPVLDNQHGRIYGYFQLSVWNENGTLITLYTDQCEELGVEFTPDGGMAAFRGSAELTIQQGESLQRYSGELKVHALDGRSSPCLECPTDKLVVYFISRDPPLPITYEFQGYVIPSTGDIRVFCRCGR
jgi:hypothetical protein